MTEPTKTRGNWKTGALMASLAVNLFLGGFVVARLLKPEITAPPQPVVDLNLGSIPEGLPRAALERIEDAMHNRRHEIRNVYSNYRRTQRETVRLLMEEKLDEKALEEAYRQMRELSNLIQAPIQDAVVQALKDVSVAERRRMIRSERRQARKRSQPSTRVDGNRWRFELRDGKVDLDFDDLFKDGDEDGQPRPE